VRDRCRCNQPKWLVPFPRAAAGLMKQVAVSRLMSRAGATRRQLPRPERTLVGRRQGVCVGPTHAAAPEIPDDSNGSLQAVARRSALDKCHECREMAQPSSSRTGRIDPRDEAALQESISLPDRCSRLSLLWDFLIQGHGANLRGRDGRPAAETRFRPDWRWALACLVRRPCPATLARVRTH
jgi:hypothetical protein